MTLEEVGICLWSLSDTLQLNKLLQGGLVERSIFSFAEVGGQLFDSEEPKQAAQIALLCVSGSTGSEERSLTLY